MPAAVSFESITCTFAGRGPAAAYTAVRDVTLAIGEGEFVSVVGPTGCGKSTLLNVAAGLLRPSSGTLRVLGAPLAGINRRAGYMFQSEALMPWRSALANVTAGLEFAGVERGEARQRAGDWLARVGLAGFGIGHAPVLQAQHHVVEGAAPRHQGVGLEHVARAAVDAPQRFAEHPHVARGRLQQAGGDVQQRGLAAARGADHRNEFAGTHLEGRVGDCGVARVPLALFTRAKGDGDPVQLQRVIRHRAGLCLHAPLRP